ncbi:hypothetical protein AB6N23_03820 [Cellulomonas sp. 179-A 9B4 NHS]|uniref:hypothetical protein n=1 Tax=Cellulomonas sp. 179-A 9B4 NHS TaxID=3142379 RepID=UPI00399FDD65
MSASSIPGADRGRPYRRTAVVVVAVALLAAAVVGIVAGGPVLRLTGILATVVVVGGAVVVATPLRTTRHRHAAVRALRRKADVIEVRGAVGLRDALAGEKALRAPVHARRRTPLSLAVSSEGVELWAGGTTPSLVYSARWSAVEAFEVIAERAAGALVIVTARGNRLMLEPARHADGSPLRARENDVRDLVATLEAAHAAGVAAEAARAARGLRRRRR